MTNKDDELERLRQELEALRSNFREQLAGIETRLDALSVSQEEPDNPWQAPSPSPQPAPPEPEDPWQAPPPPPPQPTRPDPKSDIAEPVNVRRGRTWNQLDASDAWVEEQFRRYAGRALVLIVAQLGSLSQLLSMGLDTYRHYREQGRGAVFMMTAAGAIALILGFGFLLQYSFNNYLGDLARVVFSFCCAEALCMIGIYINRRRSRAVDYGSALIGVGVVLNYLSVYFLGPYYGFIGVNAGLVLFVLVSMAGIGLAMVFQTRIVALVALLGGSLTPFILDAAGTAGSYYFLYQLVVAAAYLWVAERIAWYLLTRVAFLASVISVGFQLIALDSGFDLLTILSMHGFFYLFGVHLILSLRREKEQSRNITVTVSTSLLVFFALALWHCVDNPVLRGALYLGNGVVLLASVFFIQRKALTFLVNPIPMILLGFGGLLGLAIYTIVGGELLGLLWAFEGLLLVVLGFIYREPSTRIEGYFIVVVGLVLAAYHTLLWVSQFPVLGFDTLWLQLAVLGVALWSIEKVLARNLEDSNDIDQLAGTVAKDAFSVWISILCLSSAAVIIPGYWLITAAVPMALLLFRGRQLDSSFATTTGLVHFFLFLIQVFVGMVDAGSFMFRDLPVAAKIGMLESAVCLWLFQWYFQKFDPGSYFTAVSFYLRQLFFVLVPVFFLPRIVETYPDLLPFGLWASLGSALILYHYTKSRALLIESIVLVWCAAFITLYMVAVGSFTNLFGAMTLAGGLLTFLVLGYLTSAWNHYSSVKSPYKECLDIAPHYLACTIWLGVGMLSRDAGLACGALVVYYTFIVTRWPLIGMIRSSFKLAYGVLWLMAVGAIVFHALDQNSVAPFEDLVVLLTVATLLYRRFPHRRFLNELLFAKEIKFWILHGLIALTYMVALEVWFGTVFGPWTTVMLVIQATAVLFESQRPAYAFLMRLALFLYVAALVKILGYDMADFSLVQKVIAFIVIGIVLLVSAYQMQKFRDRFKGDVTR
jgi:hypothetical protein